MLPDGTTPAEGASCFINPLTSLAMLETMKREGHSALVHTAAASNLGQMLNKVCMADGIGLVNVVRSQEQEDTLRALGAVHVCNSTSPGFTDALTAAIVATGATIAFDAIGGGPLAGKILTCMETAANRHATTYNRYGSTTHKQVYCTAVSTRGPSSSGAPSAWRGARAGGWCSRISRRLARRRASAPRTGRRRS